MCSGRVGAREELVTKGSSRFRSRNIVLDQLLEQIGTRGTLAGEACEIVGQVAVAEPQEVVQLLASPSGRLFRTTHVFLELIVHQSYNETSQFK